MDKDIVERRLASVEGEVALIKQAQDDESREIAELKEQQKSMQGFQQKMILLMLGLIAALAGADTFLKGFGHTPVVEQVAYYSAVFYFILMSIYLLYNALQKSLSIVLMASAIIALFAAMVRINQGFILAGTFGSMEVAIASLLVSLLCCAEGVRLWHRHTQ